MTFQLRIYMRAFMSEPLVPSTQAIYPRNLKIQKQNYNIKGDNNYELRRNKNTSKPNGSIRG